ncbi:MAG TPA: Sec-independent protein translocase subunit TatA [Actinomycetota bacterium]|nr:Sec-independent protein translocase subunit TatA [Actinomycetota bacterium]
MFSNLRGWEPIILILLVVLLFGAKRLPDAARGLGRSLRIFKAETKGLAGSTAADTEGPTPVAGPAEADTRASDAPATEPTPGEQTPTQT